jgi:hypothetical protein
MPTVEADLFTVHKLNEEGFEKAQALAAEFSKIAVMIDEMGVGGRQKSLAFTKLEEACFFAKKAMALNPRYQLKEE